MSAHDFEGWTDHRHGVLIGPYRGGEKLNHLRGIAEFYLNLPS
jgi:hypothetical protein